jgi:hypothetical protein
MQRTSLRTLVLLLELFAAVVSLQYLVGVNSARASAIWLAGESAANSPAPAQDVNDTVST